MENHFNCIYMYVNKINKKVYIGKAKDFIKRHEQHLKGDLIIDRALKKYGEENFSIVFLEEDVEDNLRLNQLEKFYITEYDSYCRNGKGYNIAEGGNGGNTLEGMTDEQRQEHSRKTSEGLKGRVFTDEHRKHLSEASASRIYEKHNEETKQKMSETHKERWQNISNEEKEKFIEQRSGEKNPFYGKHHTEEWKCKQSKKVKKYHEKYGHPSIKRVIQYDKNNNLIKVWNSIKQVEDELKIHHSAISMCCQGKRKTAGGYIWKYAKEKEVI
ncbi:GIY-YIG nuclease family protein [bacterium]|nr:GIY-YIG nuclease family protein [bacterium]